MQNNCDLAAHTHITPLIKWFITFMNLCAHANAASVHALYELVNTWKAVPDAAAHNLKNDSNLDNGNSLGNDCNSIPL